MDAAIAEKVFGWDVCRDPNCEGCDCPVWLGRDGWCVERSIEGALPMAPFCPANDIGDAWEVIEKVYSLGLGWMLVSRLESNDYWAYQQTGCGGADCGDWCDRARTAPLAICRAALLAIEKGKGT